MIEQNEIVLKGHAYKVRCLDCEKGNSKKGNPQLVQTFEIFDAEPISQDEETVDINGIKILNWQSLSDKSIGIVNGQRTALGLPTIEVCDLDDIDASQYKGCEAYAYIKTEVSERTVDGEPIINPHTGKQEVDRFHRIVGWPKK